MASREFTADDVVFSFNRQNTSAKKFPDYYDYISKVVARDRYTVAFEMKEYNADWDYRFGWGYYSQIIHQGTGRRRDQQLEKRRRHRPVPTHRLRAGQRPRLLPQPDLLGQGKDRRRRVQTPFVDRVAYRVIKDEATQHAALRSAKLDILEAIRWQAVDNLKKSAPQLKWAKWLNYSGTFLSMRVDTKPFDDIRVRRALNLAVNKQEIVKEYYGGKRRTLRLPATPRLHRLLPAAGGNAGLGEGTLRIQPREGQEAAGGSRLPQGFHLQDPGLLLLADNMDLLPLIAGYLEQVGVKLEIQPMEYGAFLSAMTSLTNAPGYFMSNGPHQPHPHPAQELHPGQAWNPSQWNDPAYNAKMDAVFHTRDETKRQQMIKEMTVEILDKAPYIWLPVPYLYTAWWPWVKNYDGELRVGAVKPGPIYARIWIDQDLKKKLGH